MSSKIIEEQRRAREEEIKLKQMRQGLIEVETKDEAAVVIPKTPKEKWQNYWYHFKWHTIGAALLTIVLSVMVVQCASRESYDFMVVIYANTPMESGRIEKIEEYIEQFAEDIDGDGKVSVEVVDCTFSDLTEDSQSKQTAVSKVQSMIAAEPKAILYIVNEKSANDLNGLNTKGFFEGEPIDLSQEFYDFCNGKTEYQKVPEGLKIGYRRIDDTVIEKNKDAKQVYKVCKRIYEELAKKEEP